MTLRKEKVVKVSDRSFELSNGIFWLPDANKKLKKGDEIFILYNGGKKVAQTPIILLAFKGKILINQI